MHILSVSSLVLSISSSFVRRLSLILRWVVILSSTGKELNDVLVAELPVQRMVVEFLLPDLSPLVALVPH